MARAAAGQKDTIAVAVMLESRADQANEDDCAAGVGLRVFVRDGLLHGARHRIVSPRCSQGWSVQGAASPQAGPMWAIYPRPIYGEKQNQNGARRVTVWCSRAPPPLKNSPRT